MTVMLESKESTLIRSLLVVNRPPVRYKSHSSSVDGGHNIVQKEVGAISRWIRGL